MMPTSPKSSLWANIRSRYAALLVALAMPLGVLVAVSPTTAPPAVAATQNLKIESIYKVQWEPLNIEIVEHVATPGQVSLKLPSGKCLSDDFLFFERHPLFSGTVFWDQHGWYSDGSGIYYEGGEWVLDWQDRGEADCNYALDTHRWEFIPSGDIFKPTGSSDSQRNFYIRNVSSGQCFYSFGAGLGGE